jgi:hypothetical protein
MLVLIDKSIITSGVNHEGKRTRKFDQGISKEIIGSEVSKSQ